MCFVHLQEIYRVKLPGKPTDIGEGKPENQNHAIIFTRGEALQTIDMNQVALFTHLYTCSVRFYCLKFYTLYRITILRKLSKWEMYWKNFERIAGVQENLLFWASGSTYLLEGRLSFVYLEKFSLLITHLSKKWPFVLVLQCFVLGFVHVKSGDQFCHYRTEGFGQSPQVDMGSLFFFW